MPELPEVEVTRRKIAPHLVGRRIAEVLTTKPSYFFVTKPAALAKALAGKRVQALTRHGKYLLAVLDDEQRLLLHLGMTGQLFTAGVTSPRLLSSTKGGSLTPEQQALGFRPDKHTHLEIRFSDTGPTLYFRDTRKFGKVELLAKAADSKRLGKLGVDALAATGADLYRAAKKRRIAIKTVLLDQGVLAGVGNIYADEALFLAKVKPTKPANKLSAAQCAAIVAAAQKVMLRSIETGGSSISDYVQPDGEDGGYQNERRVYARKGEPCLQCGTAIKRTVLATRSTFYCPSCQK
jgi:formamidopyrimidine-DNA glycosylase